MKEYYRIYGEGLNITYVSSAGVTAVTYTLTDVVTQEVFATGTAVAGNANAWTIPLTAEEARYDRQALISLDITSTTSTTVQFIVNIVRPYATATEIAGELGLTIAATPATVTEVTQTSLELMERRARMWIDGNINQFYFKHKTLEQYGNWTDTLSFDEPIVAVEKIYRDDTLVWSDTVNDFYGTPTISLDGYQLRVVTGNDIDEWKATTVIQDWASFSDGSRYEVLGSFGWEFLPPTVTEATILLVNEYLCNDFTYRARGVKSSQNDSYSLQFVDNIFSGSGNLFVDNLLAQYKKFNPKVI